ncbi:hypothetical protein FBULB1_2950 [Fusarium bulbicola]|nr:hypothetical protein FBULB1_2950 [Fusarium bulbicola]
MKESENENARQQDSNTQKKEEDAEKTQLEDEQRPGETEEARLTRESGEEEVFDYFESFEMCNDRFAQILRLTTQLIVNFFDLKTDGERGLCFSVQGVSSVPNLRSSKMMPEIIERESGFRVVSVDPSFCAVNLKEEEERLAREEEMRKEKERQNEQNAKAAPGAAAIDVETEGIAEKAHHFRCLCGIDVVSWILGFLILVFNRVIGLACFRNLSSGTDPTGALSIIAENGDDDDDATATATVDLELRKATRTAKTIATAEELLSTDDYEPAESEPWTTLPVQGVNDLEHTKGSNASPDVEAIAAAASVDDPALDTFELTQEVLDNGLKPEKHDIAIKLWRASIKGPGADEDAEGWSHVSDDGLGDDWSD